MTDGISYRCDRDSTDTRADKQAFQAVPLADGWALCWHCTACHDVHIEPLNELLIDFLESKGWVLFDALCGTPDVDQILSDMETDLMGSEWE